LAQCSTGTGPTISLDIVFDTTADHIEQLDDEALRELVAGLCEAEVSLHGQSPLSVTWGGHQNSPDGGIDVRVSLDQALSKASNLPRARLGFQVKAEDLPRSAVLAEMCLGGTLRTSIRTLAQEAGAYILVSSRSSLSDLSLQNRLDAMKDAVSMTRMPLTSLSIFTTRHGLQLG
jgi:hypothetical protein